MTIACRVFGHQEYRVHPMDNHNHTIALQCSRSWRCTHRLRFEGPYLQDPDDVAQWERNMESMKPQPSYDELKGQRDALLLVLESQTCRESTL